MPMDSVWKMIGAVSALVVWGGLAVLVLRPYLLSWLDSLMLTTRRTPMRTVFGALAVGVAIAYGGTKPVSVDPAYKCQFNSPAAGEVTLLTVTNTPSSRTLSIPARYAGYRVTTLGANFCSGLTNFTAVTIPASVSSIGAGFFSSTKKLESITVDAANTYCAMTSEDVLYELKTGKTLYALGDTSKVRFKVTYIPGTKGLGSIQSVWKEYGKSLAVTNALFTHERGFSQIGWSTNDASTVVNYKFGAAYAANASLALYPVWEKESGFVIVFDKMGGSGNFTNVVFSADDRPQQLPACTLTKTGYVFAGWAEQRYGKCCYEDGATLSSQFARKMTLYAIWLKPNCYGIAFDPDDETVERVMPYQSVELGKVAKLNPCAFKSSSGKRFAGWECAENKRRYDDGILIFKLASETNTCLTFKAIWE